MFSFAMLKKWKNMLLKKSVLHIDQEEGAFYSVTGVKGYYNDLRGKALYSKNFDDGGVPVNIAAYGDKRKQIYFPIAIFQYGLGCYDEYLETGNRSWCNKMLTMARWALENQQEDGSFNAFGCLDYPCTVSSMAQGEACSLLARAFIETGEEVYRQACIKAADFMVLDRNEGGTSENTLDGLLLFEYPDKELVLNGWIFSSFGLLDCYKITNRKHFELLWKETLRGIKANLKTFDSRFWSKYETKGAFTSPFYHRLHISLLKALNNLDPSAEYDFYIKKWTRQANHPFCSRYAFVRKVFQKLMESRKTGWFILE